MGADKDAGAPWVHPQERAPVEACRASRSSGPRWRPVGPPHKEARERELRRSLGVRRRRGPRCPAQETFEARHRTGRRFESTYLEEDLRQLSNPPGEFVKLLRLDD